jgi:putative oxidoreductase
MKILVLVARILLGLIFFVFGLNHIVPFIPMPAMPPSDMTTLSTLMMGHGWFKFYGFVEAAGGLMLLFGRFVPLGLTLIAGVGVNILLFHFTFEPSGLYIPLFCAILEVVLVFAYRESFRGVFAAKVEPHWR